MITEIIDQLMRADYYGGDEAIEFAKGGNKIPESWKEGFRKIKRKWRSRKR